MHLLEECSLILAACKQYYTNLRKTNLKKDKEKHVEVMKQKKLHLFYKYEESKILSQLRWLFSILQSQIMRNVYSRNTCWHIICPVDTGRKLNVHKTFRRRLGRLLNVLCTSNLRPVSTGWNVCWCLLKSYFINTTN